MDRGDYGYNEFQMKCFASAEGFITTNGGGGILTCYFDEKVLFYVPHGKELRPGYLTKENSYVNKLSDSNQKVGQILVMILLSIIITCMVMLIHFYRERIFCFRREKEVQIMMESNHLHPTIWNLMEHSARNDEIGWI